MHLPCVSFNICIYNLVTLWKCKICQQDCCRLKGSPATESSILIYWPALDECEAYTKLKSSSCLIIYQVIITDIFNLHNRVQRIWWIWICSSLERYNIQLIFIEYNHLYIFAWQTTIFLNRILVIAIHLARWHYRQSWNTDSTWI